MQELRIKGGYILLSRKLIEDEIFKKPPLYLKVWIYLLSRAQHKDYKELKRGELWTSIPEIQEACSWYIGYRKVTPTYKEIYSIIEWLRTPHERICERTTNGNTNGSTIVTTKGTQGILVNIENYSIYQEPKFYEGNAEGKPERIAKELRTEFEGNNINKNDKECNKNVYKNERESTHSSQSLDLIKYYSELLPGQDISAHMATLDIWIEMYSYKWTKEAIQKCVSNKGKFIKSYAEVILKNWARDGKEENYGGTRQDNGESKKPQYDFNKPYTGPRYEGEIDF